MDWINSNIKSPFWPLTVSVALHAFFIIMLYSYEEPKVASDISQNVELWAEPETIRNSISEQQKNLAANGKTQPIVAEQSDIALSKKPFAQKTVAPSTPNSKNKPLPNIQHLVEEALAKLNTQAPVAEKNSRATTHLSDMSAYKTKVINRIRPYINIPSNLVGNPTAQVIVRISSSMEIIWIKLIKSSGNTEYDQSILRTIQKMGQFPPLPANTDQTAFRSMTLTFRPH